MLLDVAQPVAMRSAIARPPATRRSARASGDDIGPPRNLEREHAVGEPGVLAVVAERERGAAALLIRGGQRPYLHGFRIDADDQPVVVALLLLWIEPQRPQVGAATIRIR